MILLTESNETYHANPAYGSSNVRDALLSPQLLRDSKDGLLKRGSEAMSFGTLAHTFFLEHERFLKEVIIKPMGLDGRTKDGKAWAAENEGKTIISAEDMSKLSTMRERMPDEVKLLMNNFVPEATVRVEMDGLPLQCRPDAWKREGNLILDLKTTKNVDEIDKSVINYGYHIQQAFYCAVVHKETGVYPKFRFVFCETESPHRWRIVSLDPMLCAEGVRSMDRGLDIIRSCQESGNWKDTSSVQRVVGVPKWMREKEDHGSHSVG